MSEQPVETAINNPPIINPLSNYDHGYKTMIIVKVEKWGSSVIFFITTLNAGW